MALGERLYHTYLIHFILLQYHSLSQQDLFLLPAANLISLQIAAIRFAAPICFSSFRTLFSENVLTIKMPRAMMQLAKMQMEQFLSWPSFTCSGETGKMRGGGTPVCRGSADMGWCMGGVCYCPGGVCCLWWTGEHFNCNDKISFISMVCTCTELKLIWSNTVSCRAQNRSISVCS